MYIAGEMFNQQMYYELEGFKDFVDNGYYELKKRLEHDACDAFLINPGSRSIKDLHLMFDYLSTIFEEVKFIGFDFFQHLNCSCKGYKKF